MTARQRSSNDYAPRSRSNHQRDIATTKDGDDQARQIRGVALAGSVAGAVMAGPMGAVALGGVVVAAGAAFCTAKERDGGAGDAARSVEKAVQNTGRAIKRSPSFKAIKRASSFKFSDDSLEAEVQRREAQMMSSQNQNQTRSKSKMRRGQRIRKLTGSIAKGLRQKHKNLVARRNQQHSQSATSAEITIRSQENNVQNNPRLTASSDARLTNSASTESRSSKSRPTRSRSWGRGRRSSSSKDDDALASVDAYVAQASSQPTKRVGELKGRGSRHGSSSSINKVPSQALDRLQSERSSLLYRIVKRTIQPYALSQDEMRAVAHHVAYTVLATLNHSQPVAAVKGSTIGNGVRDNYITKLELKLIANHITHEVETAVDKSEMIQENALSENEVMALARHIVRQVCMCVSNCTTIQEHKLSVDEMQSLAWFMKDQFQAQAYSAIALTAKELRSLAYYLKLQAHQGLDNSKSTALANHSIARDMEDFISTIEQEASSTSSVASRSRNGVDESKEDFSSDEESTDYSDSDGSYTDDYTDSEAEGSWVDDYKGSPKKPPTYDFETSLSAKSSPAGHKSCLRMGDDSRSHDDEYGSDDDYSRSEYSRSERDSEAASYDSRDGDSQIYDTDGSYDSRYDDHSESTCSYNMRQKRKGRSDRRRERHKETSNNRFELDLKNKDEPKDDASESSLYEESVCGDVDWTKEEHKKDGDSSDVFEDAVFEDAVQDREEEKKEDTGTDYPDMDDFEEASELALQIIEKMIFTP